jgi:hydrogenase-4 membrane subunit HyfE
MTAHRGIATLSSAMMVCFFVLSSMEPEYILLHFYQSLIYLVIVLMLFYFHDRWAYAIGILAPSVWLVLAYGIGLMGGAMRQVSRLMRAQRPTSDVSVVVAIMIILSVLLIVSCAYRWRQEHSGLGKGVRTFLVSFGVVAAYNAILIFWFYRMFPG